MLKKVALTFATFIVLLTTACAQLPQGGQVIVGPNIEAGLETDYLYYSPSGPSDGATQLQILQGFINAGTGPQNDYAVAREFLTSDLATRWQPNNRVIVQASRPQITLNVGDSASVAVPVSVSIDERGEYQIAKPDQTEIFKFDFIKEHGQWRISDAPDLTMVIRPVFDVIFKAYSIYFYDNQSKYLVPDVRWFPSRASTSTRLVAALLKGPSPWLAKTVHSAIPEGTTLNLNTVTIAEGIASLDLSKKALTADAGQQRLMQAQITQSLMQLPSVYSVRVSIEHGVLDTYKLPSEFQQINIPVALTDNDLVYVDGEDRQSVSGAKSTLNKMSATEFGVSANEKLAAFITSTGVYLSNLGLEASEPKLLSSRTDFLPPVIDRQNCTWLISNDGGSSLVFDARGTRLVFDSRWVADSKVSSFAISPEGSRIAVLTGENETSKLRVAAIVRKSDGMPDYLDKPISPSSGTKLFSVTWLDETKLGLLSKLPTNSVQPWVTMVGGATTFMPRIANAKNIVGSGQSSTVYVLDIFGSMHMYRTGTWQRVADSINAVH